MLNFTYPSSRTLRRIAPERIVDLQRPRPTFQVFPVRDYTVWRLEWEQRDNYRGFQQLRGLNGQPSYVAMQGGKRFSQEPAVFGEYMPLDEAQMTVRASMAGTALGDIPANEEVGFGAVDVTDLVLERQQYLSLRETDLLEFCHWAMLLNGTFTLLGPNGAQYVSTYATQTATMTDWTDLDNATPYFDLLGLSALTIGKSVVFNNQAQMWINSTTAMNLMRNRNPNDIGGMRTAFGVAGGFIRAGVPMTVEDINTIFRGANIPLINVYDEGYNRESDGAFVRWLPDMVGSIWGRRTNGDPLGEYRMVRNANNATYAPGRYSKVIDTLDREVPRKISVHQGHNGGLVLFYPSAVIRANV